MKKGNIIKSYMDYNLAFMAQLDQSKAFNKSCKGSTLPALYQDRTTVSDLSALQIVSPVLTTLYGEQLMLHESSDPPTQECPICGNKNPFVIGGYQDKIGFDSTASFLSEPLTLYDPTFYNQTPTPNNNNCLDIDCDQYLRKPGLRKYLFYSFGLKNISRGPLQIDVMDWAKPSKPLAWTVENGGQQVYIDWGGGPISDGECLQYALLPIGSDSALQWQKLSDCPQAQTPVAPFYIVNSSGKDQNLYFKVVGMSQDDRPFTDSYGSYTLSIKVQVPAGDEKSDGPLATIARTTNEALFGSTSGSTTAIDTSTVAQVFTGLTQHTAEFILLIRLLLTLSIIVFAIALAMGLTELNQHEAVSRMLKIAFVVAIISPTSWAFFGHNLVHLFVDGSLSLISVAVTGMSTYGTTSSYDFSQDPYKVFQMFDGPISILFDETTWKKMSALIFTGLLGFIIVILIGFSAVVYVFAMVKATIIYVYCMLAVAFLIILTPIVLPFLLFEHTKNMFDIWWKSLLACSVQPFIVFSSVSLFNMMIIVILAILFGSTACKFCLLSLPIIDVCLFNGWENVVNLHYPPMDPSSNPFSFFLPPGVLSASLLLFILSFSMLQFIGFIPTLVNKMILEQAGAAVNAVAGTAQSTLAGAKTGASFVYHYEVSGNSIAKGVEGTKEYLSAYRDIGIEKGKQSSNSGIRDAAKGFEFLSSIGGAVFDNVDSGISGIDSALFGDPNKLFPEFKEDKPED